MNTDSMQNSQENTKQYIMTPLTGEVPGAVDMNVANDANLNVWEQTEEIIPNPVVDASSDFFLDKLKELVDSYSPETWKEFETTIEEITEFAQDRVGINKKSYKGANLEPPNNNDPSTALP